MLEHTFKPKSATTIIRWLAVPGNSDMQYIKTWTLSNYGWGPRGPIGCSSHHIYIYDVQNLENVWLVSYDMIAKHFVQSSRHRLVLPHTPIVLKAPSSKTHCQIFGTLCVVNGVTEKISVTHQSRKAHSMEYALATSIWHLCNNYHDTAIL